uniref:Uncharacterized protein n=1 Tax=Moniliophthora roreri TaxID=221103 RepID=A0A0W0FA25_MONRR
MGLLHRPLCAVPL